MPSVVCIVDIMYVSSYWLCVHTCWRETGLADAVTLEYIHEFAHLILVKLYADMSAQTWQGGSGGCAGGTCQISGINTIFSSICIISECVPHMLMGNGTSGYCHF